MTRSRPFAALTALSLYCVLISAATAQSPAASPHPIVQNYSHGTAIAVIRTADAIFIAADSRAVNGTTGERRPDECKIRIAGNYFFSIHGVADADILDATKKILLGRDNLSAKAQKVRDALTPTVAQRMRGQTVDHFSSGVFMFGLECGVLRLAYVKWPVSPPGIASEATINECPGIDCPTGIAMPAVSPYGDKLASDARALDDVRNFVLGQISKGSALEKRDGKTAVVGAPIQSFTLYRNGQHLWHDEPEVCKGQR
jgi:hypothetical protein